MKRPGFTLVEAVFCMLLVSVLLVAALSAAGASGASQSHASDRGRGIMLAEALMSEILVQPYQDTTQTPIFGPEPGDTTVPPSRARFNDVDDYNVWTESPPQNKDGSVMANLTGWSRSISVIWVSTTDFTRSAGYETGVKQITVTVAHNNTVVATCTAIKANNPTASN